LHIAAGEGYAKIASLLITSGAEIDIKNNVRILIYINYYMIYHYLYIMV